jgi:hypothetical protein
MGTRYLFGRGSLGCGLLGKCFQMSDEGSRGVVLSVSWESRDEGRERDLVGRSGGGMGR